MNGVELHLFVALHDWIKVSTRDTSRVETSTILTTRKPPRPTKTRDHEACGGLSPLLALPMVRLYPVESVVELTLLFSTARFECAEYTESGERGASVLDVVWDEAGEMRRDVP
jgi:hypothetical protein